MELKSYLSSKFEGRESFLENIVFPIFGEDRFEDMYDVDALDNEDLQAMARRTGIKSAIFYGLVQVGTTEINIYDVTVSDRVMMRRNRVGIQQLIRRIMLDYTSAFIIFHYEDSDSWDWRFSFCQKDNKEVTEAKRYTFLLGPGQSCRTAAENFQKLIDKHGEINRDDIVAAFDVEALSKEFFDKYKAKYEKFCNYIYDNRNDEELFGHEFAEWDEKLIRAYVKKLLGRIVFLHFLQKKGWLGVPVDKQWGEGDTQFMRNLFKASTQKQKDNYLDLVLEPLFAGALNTQRPNDIFDLGVEGFRTTRIPYLNGGLFERDVLDEPKSTFPASYFEDLFEFFYQYNFTIDENDPNDAEVGIDPEMLGHIFENLLEDNKDKGAFYTPKEIVQYMCRESLIAYLTTCVMKKQGENHKPEDEIKESVRKLLNKPEEIVPRMRMEHLDDFGSYIRNVKICDPAIGSGAFPMGLLNELVRCRVFINAWAKDDKGNLLEGDYAALKTEIISNNIYGVDIEKGAIDIARLRFWLSIIVDEQKPHVLPNFDYKFMQGNSLIPTFDGKFINLETKQIVNAVSEKLKTEKKELYRLKQLHYNASGEEKNILDIKIKCSILRMISMRLGAESRAWHDTHCKQATMDFGDEQSQVSFDTINQSLPVEMQQTNNLAKALYKQLNDASIPVAERSQIDIRFFDWRIMFTEVFDNGSDGFDIVIGNPPYNELRDLSNEMQNHYKHSFYHRYAVGGRINMFQYFYPLGLSLSKKDGIICLITQNSLLAEDSALNNRKLLFENSTLLSIDSYPERDDKNKRVFESAKMSVCFCVVRNNKCSEERSFNIKIWEERQMIHVCILSLCRKMIKNIFKEDYTIPICSQQNLDVLVKMKKKAIGSSIVLSSGEIDMTKYKPFFVTEPSPNRIRVITGAQVLRYEISDNPSQGGIKYVDKNKLVLSRKRQAEFNSTRLVMQRITGVDSKIRLIATSLPLGMCCANSTNYISSINNNLPLNVILAILNAKASNFFFKATSTNTNVTNKEIEKLPIPMIDNIIQKKLIKLVDLIVDLKNKKDNTSTLEFEIDQIVYQLYGLTDEEIAIVEGKNE